MKVTSPQLSLKTSILFSGMNTASSTAPVAIPDAQPLTPPSKKAISTLQKAERWMQRIMALSMMGVAINFGLQTAAKRHVELAKQTNNAFPIMLSLADIKRSYADFEDFLNKLPNPTPIQQAFLSEKLMSHFETINEAHREAGKASLDKQVFDYSHADPDVKKHVDMLLEDLRNNAWPKASVDLNRFVDYLVRTNRLDKETGAGFIEADITLQTKMKNFNQLTQHIKPTPVYKHIYKAGMTLLIVSLLGSIGISSFKPKEQTI